MSGSEWDSGSMNLCVSTDTHPPTHTNIDVSIALCYGFALVTLRYYTAQIYTTAFTDHLR